VRVRFAGYFAAAASTGTTRRYRTVPMSLAFGSVTYRPQGPSAEPGNVSTSLPVHSGGFNQFERNVSSSFAAAAIASRWAAVGSGKGKVSNHEVAG
jgi:hypothetical protein